MNIEILTLDEPNKNHRIYTTEAVEQAIEKLSGKEVFGQLGIPDGQTLKLENVSHVVDKFRIENGKLIGTMRVLDTPQGKVLRQLLEAEIRMDFRPRGYASIGSDGVVSDYEIISVDQVSNPA